MSDRELLVLAAKAAGKDAKRYPDDVIHWAWNPLTDDCDALRLAVKLGIGVFMDALGAYCNYNYTQQVRVYFAQVPDHCTAARLAIVLAAAEIEKGLK